MSYISETFDSIVARIGRRFTFPTWETAGGDAINAQCDDGGNLKVNVVDASAAGLATEATLQDVEADTASIDAHQAIIELALVTFLAAQRNATTPDLADAAQAPQQLNRTGGSYIAADLRHQRHLVLPVTDFDFLSSDDGVECNAVCVDTDDVILFAQPVESDWVVPIDFAGATGVGWAIVGGQAVHTPANTAALTLVNSSVNPPVVGDTYLTIFGVSGRTAGDVAINLGTAAGTSRNADGVYVQAITCATSSTVTFTVDVTGDFDGTLTKVYLIPQTCPIKTGAWRPEAFAAICGVATAALPTTLSTTIKVWAGFYRRPNAAELGT